MPLLLLGSLTLAACSGAGPVVLDLPRTDGERHPLLGAPHASVAVPKDLEVVAPLTWVWQTPDGPLLLGVRRNQEPREGMHAALDREIRQMQAGGEADVMADHLVQLGDLEGRLVEATTTKKDAPPTALWLLLCGAEDGLYALSVAGPTVAMGERRKDLQAFLTSLRVATPPPPPAPRAGTVPDLVAPPPAASGE